MGILGRVWYLIVSIPDLCTLTYFYKVDGGQCVKSNKIGIFIFFSGKISLYEFKGQMISII